MNATALNKIQPFGPLDVDTESALRRSIEKFGIVVPVIVDQRGRIIDGHNRSRIAKERGIRCPQERRIVRDDDDAAALAYSLNADRRHMTREARMEIVEDLRAQGFSLRAIAGAVGISEKRVRDDLADAQVRTPYAPADEPPANVDEDGVIAPPTGGAAANPGQREEEPNEPEAAAPAVNVDITVGIDGKKYPKKKQANKDGSPEAVAQRRRKIQQLAEAGYTSVQIAEKLDMARTTVLGHVKAMGIRVPGDEVMGRRTGKLDPNVVMQNTVDSIVLSTSDLTGVIDDFATLDGDHIDEWISSLDGAIRSLQTLKRSLTKELTRA